MLDENSSFSISPSWIQIGVQPLMFEVLIGSMYLPLCGYDSEPRVASTLGARVNYPSNRHAVASRVRNPYRVDYLEPLLPQG
jgi:hypothetical protein